MSGIKVGSIWRSKVRTDHVVRVEEVGPNIGYTCLTCEWKHEVYVSPAHFMEFYVEEEE